MTSISTTAVVGTYEELFDIHTNTNTAVHTPVAWHTEYSNIDGIYKIHIGIIIHRFQV